jgi:hypothetical protein
MTPNDDVPATRRDIKQLEQATHRDIEQLEQASKIALAREVSKLHGEMADMKQELLANSQQQADRILSRLDFYTARIENYRTDTILHGHVPVEVETKLNDHELRLSKIEAARKERES